MQIAHFAHAHNDEIIKRSNWQAEMVTEPVDGEYATTE